MLTMILEVERILNFLIDECHGGSHGSGVGDCARYGGKGGVGCLITFVKGFLSF